MSNHSFPFRNEHRYENHCDSSRPSLCLAALSPAAYAPFINTPARLRGPAPPSRRPAAPLVAQPGRGIRSRHEFHQLRRAHAGGRRGEHRRSRRFFNGSAPTSGRTHGARHRMSRERPRPLKCGRYHGGRRGRETLVSWGCIARQSGWLETSPSITEANLTFGAVGTGGHLRRGLGAAGNVPCGQHLAPHGTIPTLLSNNVFIYVDSILVTTGSFGRVAHLGQ